MKPISGGLPTIGETGGELQILYYTESIHLKEPKS